MNNNFILLKYNNNNYKPISLNNILLNLDEDNSIIDSKINKIIKICKKYINIDDIIYINYNNNNCLFKPNNNKSYDIKKYSNNNIINYSKILAKVNVRNNYFLNKKVRYKLLPKRVIALFKYYFKNVISNNLDMLSLKNIYFKTNIDSNQNSRHTSLFSVKDKDNKAQLPFYKQSKYNYKNNRNNSFNSLRLLKPLNTSKIKNNNNSFIIKNIKNCWLKNRKNIKFNESDFISKVKIKKKYYKLNRKYILIN